MRICKIPIPPAVCFQQGRLLPRLSLSCNCILTQQLSPLQYGFSPRDVVGVPHFEHFESRSNISALKDYLLVSIVLKMTNIIKWANLIKP